MLEINELNNTSVLISSLDKIYNLGRLNGKLKSIDLYVLNIIFKLLNGCCIELTHDQRRMLMELYRHFYFNTEYICPVSHIQGYIAPVMSQFTQAESADCNDYTMTNKIHYWQESSLNTTIYNILSLITNSGYFLNKKYDTKENFVIGKTIEYTNIGRICFSITEALDTEEYKVYDVLNNDVTNTFDIAYIHSIKTMLFVSKNVYSHGNIFFKIKKTNNIFYTGIFNDTFNDIFN